MVQMDCALKTVPVDLRSKMEALVHDLSLALEESENNSNIRRRWSIRRRARSTGNICKDYIASLSVIKISEDSSSSMCDIHTQKDEERSKIKMKYQSDSDDTNCSKLLGCYSNLNNPSNAESDSVNENFTPRTTTRRKRKFKRMAIDSDSNPSTSQTTNFVTSNGKKKRIFKTDCENRYDAIWCGKRKRSCRERSTDCENRSSKTNRSLKAKNKEKSPNESAMDCSRLSSSSISSSDSEAGFNTNDEDREGDDEQSDWVGDSSWCEENENVTEEKICFNPLFHTPLDGNLDHSNDEIKRNYRQRIPWIRDGSNGREILAGRRHVDNTPGCSIITSANEKVSRFLQDPSQRELRLHSIRQFERDKLRRLANLYSLNLKGDLSSPILYKTKYTTQAICVDHVPLNRLSDYKRLRKTPPNCPNIDLNLDAEIQNVMDNNVTALNQLPNSEPRLYLPNILQANAQKITDIPLSKIHNSQSS